MSTGDRRGIHPPSVKRSNCGGAPHGLRLGAPRTRVPMMLYSREWRAEPVFERWSRSGTTGPGASLERVRRYACRWQVPAPAACYAYERSTESARASSCWSRRARPAATRRPTSSRRATRTASRGRCTPCSPTRSRRRPLIPRCGGSSISRAPAPAAADGARRRPPPSRSPHASSIDPPRSAMRGDDACGRAGWGAVEGKYSPAHC